MGNPKMSVEVVGQRSALLRVRGFLNEFVTHLTESGRRPRGGFHSCSACQSEEWSRPRVQFVFVPP